jgi:hypothetical protein
MFNLFRIKKKHINNYFVNKRNYLPKNVLSYMKNNSLYKPFLYNSFLYNPSAIYWNKNMNNLLIQKEKPEMIVFFYMILGITFGTFIYYIKL